MPTQPFCCGDAIPKSLTHLLAYVGDQRTHVLVDASPKKSSAGLITTFLTSAAMSRIYPQTSEPPLPPNVELRTNGSLRAIIQVTKSIPTNDPLLQASEVSKAFYAPYGSNDREKIVCGDKEPLFWVLWKEISEGEADWCIKPEGSGHNIGDGERWALLTDKETLWCDRHRVFWELKAWIRET